MTEQNAGFDHVVEDLAAIAGVQKSSRLSDGVTTKLQR
jgi:hypothetical protein